MTSARRGSKRQPRNAVKNKKNARLLKALNLQKSQSKKVIRRSERSKLNSRTSMVTPLRLFKFSKISTSLLLAPRNQTTLHLVTVYPMSRRRVLYEASSSRQLSVVVMGRFKSQSPLLKAATKISSRP